MNQTVQQLSAAGGLPPPEYMWSSKIEVDAPMATSIPIIDVGNIDSNLVALHSALTTWGCFQAINHGIERSLLDQVRQQAKDFFHQPTAEKLKYTKQSEEDVDGFSTAASPVVAAAGVKQLEWLDKLRLLVAPPDMRIHKYWPNNPKSFGKVLDAYSSKVREAKQRVLRATATSLNLPDADSFLNKVNTISAQFNYYPPCATPDRVFGLRPHTDGTAVTFLLQDECVRGLQLQKDGVWLSVPLMPHAILVLAGDQLEIMSNGIFHSAMHRVVINSDRERNSLAMFCSPDAEQEIEPLDQLVTARRPKAFKKIKNYAGTFYQYYHRGQRAIDALRI